ncbi:uncharacterized protein LOC143853894 [Tasmannia lanceolata]|uniref:uncharacterized protein LOC143853894 n=1 Tax=Tasmannia lanceolata TaxID=3420 RepID=UPI004063B32F
MATIPLSSKVGFGSYGTLVEIHVHEESSQLVHYEAVFLQSKFRFNLTVIYAHNYYVSRRSLWSDMEEIASRTHLPWLVVGDFNVVRYPNERFGGSLGSLSEMEELSSCISVCSLADINAIGHTLTWNNKSSIAERKLAKLDRVLVNDQWITQNSSSFADFLPHNISDHCKITVSLFPHPSLGPKPFKFMNMWLADTSLYPIVEMAWQTKVRGNPMYVLTQKLKEVRNKIRQWHKDVFGRINNVVPIIRKNLEETQNSLAANPADRDLIQKENSLCEDLIHASAMEEALYRQKFRVQWLKLGDSNTKIFYSAIKSHHNRNNMRAIQRADGSVTTDLQEISDIFVDHFKNILNNRKVQTKQVPNPLRILS